MASTEPPQPPAVEDEEYDSDVDAEGDDDDDDDDIDAEAEEMARRLGAQLWGDIQNSSTSAPAAPAPAPIPNPKTTAAISTIKSIMALASRDPVVQSTFTATFVPGIEGTILDIFARTVTSGTISTELVLPLSQIVMGLARSETLFGKLPAFPETTKRKRNELDEALPPAKRHYVPSHLTARLTEAVRTVDQVLSTTRGPVDASLISSIHLPLHQIFLFAVTASARGGPEMNTLQEISGLIQALGVVSGIQIGQSSNSTDQPSPDIGTAVYPCVFAGCSKTFSRLYGLRTHQRFHVLIRPFCCAHCTVCFARNHDLKRHSSLHTKKAWKCAGCDKIFSRRDALKRHRNGAKARGPKAVQCIDAEEIAVAGPSIEVNETETDLPSTTGYESIVEDGEIDPAVISGMQKAVETLHARLQGHVVNALGTPSGQSGDPSAGQVTLASVIARAQLQASTAEAVAPEPNDPQATIPASTLLSDQNAESTPQLSMYGLSDEQTKLLEEAIATAALAAQAQAEAEAALESDEESDGEEEDEDEPAPSN
ncbi:hypothetical protein C8J56DRAFT_1168497 [Mycena floridula]|nr:hypothetical protein C8J56DRAFT_1168497 [Mycena floridula]